MRWSLLLLFFMVFAPAAPGQELNDRDQAFMKEFKTLRDLQDLRAINKLVQREAVVAREVVDTYCYAYAKDGDPKVFDDVKQLVVQMDEVEGNKRLQKRLEFLQKLKDEPRKIWLDVVDRVVAALTLYEEARTRKEPAAWQKAAQALDEVVQMAARLGDLENSSNCRYYLGLCHEGLSEYEAEVADFDKAMDEWLASGRVKDATYAYMTSKRAELIGQGYDPEQKKGDKGGSKPAGTGKKSATTSYTEGSQWQDWPADFKEMKSPDQLPTTSPWCGDFILLWREFGFSDKSAHRLGLLSQAAPFGKGLNVVRDGAHAFIRQAEDKKSDVPVKVLDNKPTLASIKSGEKDGERFAVYLTTGGQGATWFGTTVNYQQSGRYRVGWYREAKVLGETIQLLDDNCSGELGDPLATRDNILKDGPDWVDNDGLIIGKKLMAWSDVVPIGPKWYHLQLADKRGAKLRTRELDIETGQVVLKWNGPVAPRVLVVAEMRDFKGCFYDVAGGKPVTVPVGRYEIAYGEIETGKGAQEKQAWLFKGDSKPFDVNAKETTTLDMGAPYKLDFTVKQAAKSVTIEGKSLMAREKSGAVVGRVYDEVFCPDVWTRTDPAGNGAVAPKGMARIDATTMNKDNAAAWFPADFVFDKAKDAKLQVQLKLARHGLLGGPFTSEWK